MQMPPGMPKPRPIPDVKHVVAVSSGKGGVGKTTVSVNLSVALARQGQDVGLLDADIYGPNVPMMLGAGEQPRAVGGKIIPLENHGVKLMSLGLIAGEDTPVIWRGPIVGKMIQQFMSDVAWGALDFLVVDLPPGTGDAQLTLAQTVPLSGAVIVTTPQDVALEDVTRSVEMFRKVDVPILGAVEKHERLHLSLLRRIRGDLRRGRRRPNRPGLQRPVARPAAHSAGHTYGRRRRRSDCGRGIRRVPNLSQHRTEDHGPDRCTRATWTENHDIVKNREDVSHYVKMS